MSIKGVCQQTEELSDFPGDLDGKESIHLQGRRPGFDSGSG